MFDFIEEALNQIALAIECIIAGPFDNPVFLWRDNDVRACLRDEIDDRVGVITLVSKDVLRGNTGQEFCGL